jgi:hypothetical protein
LFIPQQRSPHILTSFNNAAQTTRMSSNTNKRSSLLRGLFGRYSSRKRTPIIKQSLKTSQQATKKRIISGGDQVKLSSTRIYHMEQPYQLKHHYDMNMHGDTDHQVQLVSQGIRYDFKQMKSINKQSSKDNC